MLIIEASRRTSRAAVERLRESFLEFDKVAFKNVDIAAEDAYRVIRVDKAWAMAIEDPTLQAPEEPEERTYDCGD